jgi:hypothetical protein
MSISAAAQRPNLMVGVPSGYLSPRLPFPPNVEYNVSVGVEVAPGLGISLDGKTILVGAGGHQGRTDIIGRLKDGTMPQRDTVVLRSGEETTVDGYYGWQDYKLQGRPDQFTAVGAEPVKGFTVTPTENGFRVENPKSARAWTVENNDAGFAVRSDFAEGETFQVSKAGNTTLVDSNLADQDFTITQQPDGTAVIDGHLRPEDFTLNPTGKGYDLQGHYDQQHFQIVFS